MQWPVFLFHDILYTSKIVTEAWCLTDEACTQINVTGIKVNTLYLNLVYVASWAAYSHRRVISKYTLLLYLINPQLRTHRTICFPNRFDLCWRLCWHSGTMTCVRFLGMIPSQLKDSANCREHWWELSWLVQPCYS